MRLRAWAVVFALVSSSVASAQTVEHRGQLWWVAVANGKLGPTARMFIELQPRFGLTPRFRIDTVIFRAGLGAEVLAGLTLWAGFGWFPSWATENVESVTPGEGRFFEQVQYSHAFDQLGLQLRFRFEQRFLPNVGGLLWRPRLLVRVTYRIVQSPALQLAIHDEIFFNLNQRPGTAPTGFDQNRAYVGFGWWATPSFLLELGYQTQMQRRADPAPFRFGHTLTLTTAYNF